jgi:multicomponent Na+:H+ antiporter subunit C
MTANLTLAIAAGILVACGVYLLLERSLTRILLGIIIISNGVNLLFLVASGSPGTPPIVGLFDPETTADPLPQAMVLTAIVITMGTTAFVLALAYRSFQLNGHDEVADDVEDARIRQLAQADEQSESYEETRFSDSGEDVVSE